MTMPGCRNPSLHSCEGEGSIEVLIADFDRHLMKVRGLSPATRFYRRRYAREFLEWRFEGKRWDPTKLCFADFVEYVKLRAPRLKPASIAVMMTSLRSLVRFLDWVLLASDSMKLPDGFEPVFGYNAVRVPLYLAWAGIEPAEYYAPFRQLSVFSLYPEYYATTREGSIYSVYAYYPPIPAKITLPTGKAVNLPSTAEVERALPGMVAIYELVSGIGDLHPPKLLPYGPVNSEETYYSVSLGLLSNCACLELRGNRP